MRIAASLVAGLLVVLSLAGCNNRYDNCNKAATKLCELKSIEELVESLDVTVEQCVASRTWVCVNRKE